MGAVANGADLELVDWFWPGIGTNVSKGQASKRLGSRSSVVRGKSRGWIENSSGLYEFEEVGASKLVGHWVPVPVMNLKNSLCTSAEWQTEMDTEEKSGSFHG